MASGNPITIESLPPELLCEILGCLDSAPPSETQLHEQPHTGLLDSPEESLKNASLVCRTWRAAALPILFRHVVWDLDRWELFRVDPSQNWDGDLIEALPILAFLRHNCLARHVDSLAMVIRDSLQGLVAGGSANVSTFRTENGEDAGSIDGLPAEHVGDSRLPRFARQLYDHNFNWLWDTLFGFLNPRTITLLASPQVLATLLSTRIYLNDAWSFSRAPIHALSLSRETRSADEVKPAVTSPSDGEASESPNGLLSELLGTVSSEVLQRPPTRLFTIRPWTHLLLNEGSSTRVYKTYEFFHRRPPSILGSLLGANRKNPPLVPPTLKSLAYVAVFPLSTHFAILVDHLPRLDRLFVQLVPRDNLLHDADEMRHVQPSDLWMERNTCYSLIMRELLSNEPDDSDSDAPDSSTDNEQENNWLHLQEFESGDAADKESWDMAVQFVCMSETDWHVEREGVLVKHAAPAEQGGNYLPGRSQHEPVLDYDGEDDTSTSPIRGNLQRLAFNGTARLPFSPMANIEDLGFTTEVPWVYTNNHTMVIDYSALIQDVTHGFDVGGGISTIGDLAEMAHFGAHLDFQEQHESDGLEGMLNHQLYQMTREMEEQVFGSRDIDAGGVHVDADLDPVDHHVGDDGQAMDDTLHPEGYIFPMDEA